MQKNLEIQEGRKEQWKPTSTPWIFFFSLTRLILYTFRKILCNFFLCSARISRIMNAKQSRNSRGKKGAMETHFTPWNFFVLSQEVSFLHPERFLIYFFLCCVRISRLMNAKKSRNSRGKTRAMETHFYIMEFFFSFTRIFL